jgi:undecaprenyl-diphosphatase
MFQQIDLSLFRWINSGWSNPVLDKVFILFGDIKFLLVPIVILILWLLVKGGKTGRILVLKLILVVVLADQISDHLIRPLVGRVRPCNALQGVHTPDGILTSYSFPAGGAALVAGIVLLVALRYPRFKWLLLFIAVMVGLSRSYLGLHYPTDVLGGYAVGLLAGLIVESLFRFVEKALKNRSRPTASA